MLEADYHDDQVGELDGDDFMMGGTLEPDDERVKRMIKESNSGPVDDEEVSFSLQCDKNFPKISDSGFKGVD